LLYITTKISVIIYAKNFLDTQIIKFVKPKKYRNRKRWRNSSLEYIFRKIWLLNSQL